MTERLPSPHHPRHSREILLQKFQHFQLPNGQNGPAEFGQFSLCVLQSLVRLFRMVERDRNVHGVVENRVVRGPAARVGGSFEEGEGHGHERVEFRARLRGVAGDLSGIGLVLIVLFDGAGEGGHQDLGGGGV